MENQHRQIKGYRELSQAEIDLMNRIKAFGPELANLIEDIHIHVSDQHRNAQGVGTPAAQDELFRLTSAEPFKWIEAGKKDLQTGLMFLTRAVAQPRFF